MINNLTLLFTVSLFFSLGSKLLGQPYLLGYILSGVFLGPMFHNTHYSELVNSLGNFGLLMLIFHIGIEFEINDFKKLWKKALSIFVLQLVFFLFFGYLMHKFLGFNIAYCLMCSFLLVLSSTAVVVRLLDEMDELEDEDESLIVSILILQDLAIVPMTIILNSMDNANVFSILWQVGLSILVLILLIFFLSNTSNATKREKILKPLNWVFDGNQEIMTLASIAMCFSFSTLSDHFGFSHSYGPFLAGLILGSLGSKKQILAFTNPIGSILMMSFFIYVGFQIDIQYILECYDVIIILTFVMLFIKVLVNYFVLRILSYNRMKSFYISIVLSQASEFSFSFLAILFANKSIFEIQYKLITTLCIISLTLGSVLPLVAQSIKRFYEKVKT